jgi:hypothetical protein
MISLASLRSGRWTAWPEHVVVFIGIRMQQAQLDQTQFLIVVEVRTMNIAASALVADSQPVQELPQAAGCRDPQPLTTLGESLQRPTALRMTE